MSAGSNVPATCRRAIGENHAPEDKHIYVDFKAPWFEIHDDLPRFDKRAIWKHREEMAEQAAAARAKPRCG
jgi:hypothetical protein